MGTPSMNCPACSGTGWTYSDTIRHRCECSFPRPDCTLCDDSGWLAEMKDGERIVRRCKCILKRKGEQLLAEAQLPELFANARFHNYDISEHLSQQEAHIEAMRYVDDWRSRDRNSILFTGTAGLGKTHLAAAMVHELTLIHQVPCMFINMQSFLARQREGMKSSDLVSDRQSRLARSIDMLVMDDLGAERLTDYSLETVTTIINERYHRNLPIIITTNHPFRPAVLVGSDGLIAAESADEAALAAERGSPDAARKGTDRVKRKFKTEITVGDQVGSRIFSRLQGMCTIVEVIGRDRRTPKRSR